MARKMQRIGRAEILDRTVPLVVPLRPCAPAYIGISEDDVQLRAFLRRIDRYVKRDSAKGDLTEQQKVEIVGAAVASAMNYAFPGTQQEEQRLAIYHEIGPYNIVPLGTFLQKKIGVCAEFATLAHVAVAHVGIENYRVRGDYQGSAGVETHAWVALKPEPDSDILEATTGRFIPGGSGEPGYLYDAETRVKHVKPVAWLRRD